MSKLNQWMAGLAEKAGVNIFPEFAGAEVLYEGDRVIGVRTGDKGLDAQGNKKGNYEPGTDLHAKVTVLGEGSRGNLTKDVIAHFKLDAGKNPCRLRAGRQRGLGAARDPAAAGRGDTHHGLPAGG